MNIKVANKSRIEEAVMRHSDDTVKWLYDKTGQMADPWQAIEIAEIEENPRCLVVWPPRFGKTWGMEAVCLKEIATNAYEREMIFGPIQKQANNALKEQLVWIETSPILNQWVAYRRGKKQLSETKYEFWNLSGAETFGILSHFDSEDATILRGEEWDDMNLETWNNRVTQRGIRKNRSGRPLRIWLSGTIQWSDGPVFIYSQDKKYKLITQFDVYDGIEFGIYNEEEVEEERSKKSHDEWLRVYLLKFPTNRNFIWDSSLRACLQEALRINWQGCEYKPGGEYKPRGMVYAGFDCGHSGEGSIHSIYRIDFWEQYGDYLLWLNAKEWESTVDPTLIAGELCDWWGHYKAYRGYGDALKANDIAMMNDMLFDRGLIDIDRTESPENKPSDWEKWAFAPKWNTGKAKYLWGTATKVKIDNKKLIIPYFDRKDDRHIAVMARKLREQLLNIRQIITNGSYPSLKMKDPSIGDDAFDATNMAIGCANDRFIIPVDFSRVSCSKGETVTGILQGGVLEELQGMGNELRFHDFGLN
jgi:hypothetical protein